jgi:hypothetical protein
MASSGKAAKEMMKKAQHFNYLVRGAAARRAAGRARAARRRAAACALLWERGGARMWGG